MSSRHTEWLAEKAKQRTAALTEAMTLATAGKYTEAERLIKSVGDSVESVAAIGVLYRELLKTLVEPGLQRQSKLAEAIFRKALNWSQHGYPDPHTRLEADDYERGRAADLAELVHIMGYDASGK